MPVDLVSAISEANEDDLKAVVARIEAIKRESAALSTVATVLRAKLGIKLPPHTARPESPATVAKQDGIWSTYRISAAKSLLYSGPAKPTAVAAACKIPSGSITSVLNHSWFDRTPDGVRLTPEGIQAVGAS